MGPGVDTFCIAMRHEPCVGAKESHNIQYSNGSVFASLGPYSFVTFEDTEALFHQTSVSRVNRQKYTHLRMKTVTISLSEYK